jgi:hypothetical protein
MLAILLEIWRSSICYELTRRSCSSCRWPPSTCIPLVRFVEGGRNNPRDCEIQSSGQVNRAKAQTMWLKDLRESKRRGRNIISIRWLGLLLLRNSEQAPQNMIRAELRHKVLFTKDQPYLIDEYLKCLFRFHVGWRLDQRDQLIYTKTLHL